MTPVKHREVDDHAALEYDSQYSIKNDVRWCSYQETALHETQEEACDNKSGEAFHKAHTHSHQSPPNDKCREVISCLEVLEHKIRGHVD